MRRISRYNHFYPWRNGLYIAYNARTGAIGLMTEDNFNAYSSISDKLSAPDQTAPLTAQDETLLKQLEYGGFVAPTDREELETLKFQHRLERYDQTTLSLNIAPSMACNLNCDYCYPDDKKGKLPGETIEAIIEFINKRSSVLKHVDINWYGGEPLLASDVIEDITMTILDLAKEKGFTYTSSMITNGYLLNKNAVDKLLKLQVSLVQVTLDGPSRIHNRHRPLKSEGDSFATVVENLKYASTKLGIAVRINIDDSTSAEDISELLDELKAADLQNRIGLYFAKLNPASKVCANLIDSCFSTVDFSQVEIHFYQLLLEKGFRIERLPTPTVAFCMAQRLNAFLLDLRGNLYRCLNEAGDSTRTIGNIREPIDYLHPNYTRLFSFDPYEDVQCRNCDILPVCMGGCPARRAEQGNADCQFCKSWKDNLHPMLEIIALSKQRQAQQAAGKSG